MLSRDCCFMIASFERLACSCGNKNTYGSRQICEHAPSLACFPYNFFTPCLTKHQAGDGKDWKLDRAAAWAGNEKKRTAFDQAPSPKTRSRVTSEAK